jgi:hypothetical protein
MSPSHVTLRAVMALSSAGLLGLTYAASGGVLPAAAALAVLTAVAVARPESWAVLGLVLGHAVHWTATAPAPEGPAGWTTVLGGAWLVLLLHVSASAAVTWPSGTAVPARGARRWAARTAVVALAVVPVWAVSAATRQQSLRGEVSMTYAAIAGLALLAGAVFLLSAPSARRR